MNKQVAAIEAAYIKSFHELSGDLLYVCESPIERLLGLALIVALEDTSAGGQWHFISNDPTRYDFKVSAQVKLGSYRVDFLVDCYSYDHHPLLEHIVIECDGHEYHERSKEQAARDRQKDRWFLLNGYTVMRFTGSEIWADPLACARQVARLVEDKAFRGTARIERLRAKGFR